MLRWVSPRMRAALVIGIALLELLALIFHEQFYISSGPGLYGYLLGGGVALLWWWLVLFFPGECDLFYGRVKIVHESLTDSWFEIEKKICGKNAIGQVRTNQGTKDFCKDHSPDTAWMKDWLGREQIIIDTTTIKMFKN